MDAFAGMNTQVKKDFTNSIGNPAVNSAEGLNDLMNDFQGANDGAPAQAQPAAQEAAVNNEDVNLEGQTQLGEVTGVNETDDASTAAEQFDDVEQDDKYEEYEESDDTLPAFTTVDVDNSLLDSVSSQCNTSLDTLQCIADNKMLLEYMVKVERTYNVTMSFHAYGVDPIVFENEAVRSEGQPPVVSINLPGGDAAGLYEIADIDDTLYLSCLDACLNEAYLKQVISEAYEAIFTHGEYIYTLVGPRTLEAGAEGTDAKMIDTLKLNSYELSLLLAAIGRLPSVEVHHIKYNGRQAIQFVLG